MTNVQLYLAIGIPIIAMLAGLTFSTVQVSGIRSEMRENLREIREDIRSIRTAIDLLIGKIGELDTRIAVLEERSKH